MNRVLSLTALAAALALPALRADDKPTKPGAPGEVTSNRAAEAKAFKEFAQKSQEFSKKYLAATPEQRKELIKDRPSPTPYIEKAWKLLDQDAKDDVALESILFIAQYGGANIDPKVFELTEQHHIKSPKIGPIVQRAGVGRPNPSPAGIALLKSALDKNPTKQVKGQACYTLASQAQNRAERTEGSEAENLNKEAEQYFVRIDKEFADVILTPAANGRPARTMGSMAKRALFVIRNLGIGKTAPEVVSHDLGGQTTKLSALRGKVVVMDFWATWCGPCKAMIPHSREFTERMKDKPFALVSISSDAKKETLTQFLEKEKMPWTHWWEGNGDTSLHNKWGINGIPTMYIVDAKGVIRYKQVGFSNASMEKMEKVIDGLVKEAEVKQ